MHPDDQENTSYDLPGHLLGSKTVISKSTSKIIFSRGKFLDTFSVKALERKFQRKTNPGPVQFGERPSWTQHGFISAVYRAGPVQFGEQPSWIDRSPSSPRPRNSSPEIASNSFLFRINQRYHWKFTI